MSTGSSKERLEQNNQSLEEIKLNAENLPEFVEINNQDKEITLNGDYTADAGYTGFGNITVNVEGGAENLQDLLDEQSTLISELQSELNNKAKSDNNVKCGYNEDFTYYDLLLSRYIKRVDTDIIEEIVRHHVECSTSSNNSLFYDMQSIEEIPMFDASNMINMKNMFSYCRSIKTIPELDTSNVTSMYQTFLECDNLETIPLLNTTKVVNMYQTFRKCKKLKSLPLLDTSHVTTMSDMLSDCWELTAIPTFDTNRVTNMYRLAAGCSSITSVPQLDTSNVTDIRYAFWGNINLVDFPVLNLPKITNVSNMFYNCANLSDESLNNILASFTSAVKVTSNKKLSYAGLSEEQATRCQSLSNYEAFTTAGWTTGY